jgi:hypothetical protein
MSQVHEREQNGRRRTESESSDSKPLKGNARDYNVAIHVERTVHSMGSNVNV